MDYGDKAAPPRRPSPVFAPSELTRQSKVGTVSETQFDADTSHTSSFVPMTRRVELGSKSDRSVDVTEALILTSRLTPAVLSASQNDYEPDGFLASALIRLSASTPVNITGFGRDGRGYAKVVMNAGSNTITLVHESASSTANKRLNLKSAANFALAAGAAVWLVYDGTSDRWRLIGA